MKNIPLHSLKVLQAPIGSLKPCLWNPRTWDDSAKSHLRESIERFGFVDPLIVNIHPDRKGNIIGGHFRWTVAKDLGLTEVPVVYVSLTEDQERELNLRLNKNTGTWDYDLLKEFDTSLLLEVGFDNDDLGNIWNDAIETNEDGFDTEKELAKITEPKTKPGQLYALGEHRLLCGNSTEEAVVKKLMGSKFANMIYSDAPYNIGLSYTDGVSTKGKYGGKTNDNLSESDYRSFLAATLQNALLVTEPDAHAFYWCDENYVGLVQSLFKEHGLDNKRTCLWIKNNFNVTPGTAFNKAYEPCVYAIRGKPYLSPDIKNLNEVLNKEIGIGNRTLEDIEELFNIWLVKRLPGQDYSHPTEKSPTLHEKALKRCTRVGDIVLDLFAGSGSTLIACEQMKRVCYTVEIEPIFCDLIISRYEKLTGTKAILLG